MTELTTGRFRTLDGSDAISNDSVVPFYLNDRKLRISIARVDGRLYAFDDLCTCTDEPCSLRGCAGGVAAAGLQGPPAGASVAGRPRRSGSRRTPTRIASASHPQPSAAST